MICIAGRARGVATTVFILWYELMSRKQLYKLVSKLASASISIAFIFFSGFRWCLAAVFNGSATVLSVEGQMVYADVAIVNTFNSTVPIFNRIHSIILQSIKANLGPVFMDCPHREKLGWLETVHLLAPSVMYNFDMRNFYKKVIRDMSESQLDNGLVPDIAPEFTIFGDGFRDR